MRSRPRTRVESKLDLNLHFPSWLRGASLRWSLEISSTIHRVRGHDNAWLPPAGRPTAGHHHDTAHSVLLQPLPPWPLWSSFRCITFTNLDDTLDEWARIFSRHYLSRKELLQTGTEASNGVGSVQWQVTWWDVMSLFCYYSIPVFSICLSDTDGLIPDRSYCHFLVWHQT